MRLRIVHRLKNLLCALNHEYADFKQHLEDGDEVAFLPAGEWWLSMLIEIRNQAFDPWQEGQSLSGKFRDWLLVAMVPVRHS